MQPLFVSAYQAAVSNTKQGAIIASVATRSTCRTMSPPKFDSLGFVTRTTLTMRPEMPAKERTKSDTCEMPHETIQATYERADVQLAFYQDSYAKIVPNASTEQGLIIHDLHDQGSGASDTTTDDGVRV